MISRGEALREDVRIGSFSGRFFPHSDLIRRYSYVSVLRPNAGKYGPEKL